MTEESFFDPDNLNTLGDYQTSFALIMNYINGSFIQLTLLRQYRRIPRGLRAHLVIMATLSWRDCRIVLGWTLFWTLSLLIILRHSDCFLIFENMNQDAQ